MIPDRSNLAEATLTSYPLLTAPQINNDYDFISLTIFVGREQN